MEGFAFTYISTFSQKKIEELFEKCIDKLIEKAVIDAFMFILSYLYRVLKKILIYLWKERTRIFSVLGRVIRVFFCIILWLYLSADPATQPPPPAMVGHQTLQQRPATQPPPPAMVRLVIQPPPPAMVGHQTLQQRPATQPPPPAMVRLVIQPPPPAMVGHQTLQQRPATQPPPPAMGFSPQDGTLMRSVSKTDPNQAPRLVPTANSSLMYYQTCQGSVVNPPPIHCTGDILSQSCMPSALMVQTFVPPHSEEPIQVRDPMPAVYFFLVDVLMNAIQTGAAAAACGSIDKYIADIPEGPRMFFRFATYDSTVHFYNLKRSQQQEEGEEEESPSSIPAPLVLTSEYIFDEGVYLLENGEVALIYVGSVVKEEILQDLFGVTSVDGLSSHLVLLQLDNKLSKKLSEVVNEIRRQRCSYLRLRLCKKGDATGMMFHVYMVEDKSPGNLSYVEFLVHVHRQIQTHYKVV